MNKNKLGEGPCIQRAIWWCFAQIEAIGLRRASNWGSRWQEWAEDGPIDLPAQIPVFYLNHIIYWKLKNLKQFKENWTTQSVFLNSGINQIVEEIKMTGDETGTDEYIEIALKILQIKIN